MNRKQAILVDIDQVICKVNYQITDPEEFDWDMFCMLAQTSNLLEPGVALVSHLVEIGYYPVFLTARPEFMRLQTEMMLANDCKLHGELVMGSAEDAKLTTNEYYQVFQMFQKQRALYELVTRYDFKYAIDDLELNCKMYWREFKIPTLQARFS